MHGLRSRPCFVDRCEDVVLDNGQGNPASQMTLRHSNEPKDAKNNDENPQRLTNSSRPSPSKLGPSNIRSRARQTIHCHLKHARTFQHANNFDMQTTEDSTTCNSNENRARVKHATVSTLKATCNFTQRANFTMQKV